MTLFPRETEERRRAWLRFIAYHTRCREAERRAWRKFLRKRGSGETERER